MPTWDSKLRREKVLHAETLKLGPIDAPVTVAASAAELNILDGVTRTAAQINLLAQGVAAGYKVARGVGAVTGTLVVASGLTTIIAVVATLKTDPAVTAQWCSATWSGTDITLKTWKPTAVDDATPIAGTTAADVNWVAIGT
jgi:hypothetical protein